LSLSFISNRSTSAADMTYHAIFGTFAVVFSRNEKLTAIMAPIEQPYLTNKIPCDEYTNVFFFFSY
jgi:hypothetical protein